MGAVLSKRGNRPLYRHRGVALLRSAAVPLCEAPSRWPQIDDASDCRAWLQSMWDQAWLVESIRMASPGLARCLDDICARGDVPAKAMRRAAISVVRYVLRATGRHTPFGLLAGVAPGRIKATTRVRWGEEHQEVAGVDSQWLADVVDRLEAQPNLLDRLDVAFTNLAVRRGNRLEAPQGPDRVSIRYTSAVQYVRDAAASPLQFGVLVDQLVEAFAGIGRSKAHRLLSSLVQQGFLITSLRAPLTVADPLAHLIGRLSRLVSGGVDTMPAVTPVLQQLVAIQDLLARHNRPPTPPATKAERASIRAVLAERSREVSTAGRTPLTLDLRLDCELQVAEQVAREVEWAADALIRLSRQPTGEAVWRDYYTAFCDRYGTGTLVPLADVVHPDAGLGFPHGYPGSTTPAPAVSGSSERDEKLLALAWQAVADGSREIVLTDDVIDSLTSTLADPVIERTIPPHVEVAARVHATSTAALERGDYTVTVAPARSAGTLTGRSASNTTGQTATTTTISDLAGLYGTVPTGVDGAIPIQLSFPPLFSHAENICRVPAYLPQVLALGEHREPNGTANGTATHRVVRVDDLAIIATSAPAGLYLVSLSCRRVLEPQVFHALALDKQAPPLARFLAHLSRGLCTAWHEFDWGPTAVRLPYLPRLRYRRSILSPARWRLTADELPNGNKSDTKTDTKTDASRWWEALEQWRRRWGCPSSVELRDADRSLPLNLTVAAHAEIVRAHLRRYGHATFTETASQQEVGWIDGRAHDIVLPLVTARRATSVPSKTALWQSPIVTNHSHGQHPGSLTAGWVYAKLYTHPELIDALIAEHLPRLLTDLLTDGLTGRPSAEPVREAEPDYWFVRYRGLDEPDHLRLRIRTHDSEQYQRCVAAIGTWVDHLRSEHVVGRLVFDTYCPEVGRYGYGSGEAMTAAENAFVADSRVVTAQLRHLAAGLIHPQALAALNLVGLVQGFLGGLGEAANWLAKQPSPAVVVDRSITDDVLEFVRQGMIDEALGWDGDVASAWQTRAEALAGYRPHVPVADSDRVDGVLAALMHMHHNRALGVDRDSEAICRRLARQIALAWLAHQDRDKKSDTDIDRVRG